MDQFEEKSLIRYIVGASRIKYVVLDELFKGIDTRKLKSAIFLVDAHSIFYRLYRNKDLATIYADRFDELVKDLVVGFMNVLGHYRRYIATRFGLDNDIYASFNRIQPRFQASMCPQFHLGVMERYRRNHVSFGFINEAIEKAWQFIVNVSRYFEGIYCFDIQGVDDFTVLDFVAPWDDRKLTIIFTRNMYACQLLGQVNNTYILYNKKDDSRLLDRSNFFSDWILRDRKLEASDEIAPSRLPLLWSIAGCSDVSVGNTKHAANMAAAVKIANRMIRDGSTIFQNYDLRSYEYFLSTLSDYTKTSSDAIKADAAKLFHRYRAFNIPHSVGALTNSQRTVINSQIVNLYDQTGVESLNELLASGTVDPELLDIDNLNMCCGMD